jgi:hypothetical protein
MGNRPGLFTPQAMQSANSCNLFSFLRAGVYARKEIFYRSKRSQLDNPLNRLVGQLLNLAQTHKKLTRVSRVDSFH